MTCAWWLHMIWNRITFFPSYFLFSTLICALHLEKTTLTLQFPPLRFNPCSLNYNFLIWKHYFKLKIIFNFILLQFSHFSNLIFILLMTIFFYFMWFINLISFYNFIPFFFIKTLLFLLLFFFFDKFFILIILSIRLN